VEVSLNRYSHMPKALREQEDTTVLWNEGVQTGYGQQVRRNH
jgi:hypothetical protein